MHCPAGHTHDPPALQRHAEADDDEVPQVHCPAGHTHDPPALHEHEPVFSPEVAPATVDDEPHWHDAPQTHSLPFLHSHGAAPVVEAGLQQLWISPMSKRSGRE